MPSLFLVIVISNVNWYVLIENDMIIPVFIMSFNLKLSFINSLTIYSVSSIVIVSPASV